ncbi:MAG: DUF6348 family protein [Polyangiales bacterium]
MRADAIELGVACFLAHPGASDDAVVNHLLTAGVAPWLAERLVTWLPVAFGRALYPQVHWPPEYVTLPRGDRHRLDDDAVYRAAALRAKRMSRDEAYAIAARSGGVRAVNAHLTKSPPAEHEALLARLVLNPPALGAPLPPVEPGDGGVPEPRVALSALLAAHGVAASPTPDGALRVGERTFEARVFPSWTHGEVSGQVDFVASGPGIASGRVCESLATSGARWADVVDDAVALFEEGVAPPLLAALCGAGGASRAAPFTHPTAGSFALHCGNVQALYGPAEPEAMEELLDQLCARLPGEAITREAHALRAFVFVHEGRLEVAEVLLDNEPWAAGEALARANPWPPHGFTWALRVFAMLSPA